jgi:hypothetical protein
MTSALAWSAIVVWSWAVSQPDASAPTQPPIVATVRVTSAKACAVDHDIVQLTIGGELSLTNQGVEPLILARGAPALEYWRIANSLEDLSSRDWAHYSNFDTAQLMERHHIGKAPDSRFVVIPVGRQHTESIEWPFLVVGSFHASRWFAQGMAFPSVGWDEGVDQVASRAWSHVGRLWTRSIKTAVFEIDIGSNPLPSCETV